MIPEDRRIREGGDIPQTVQNLDQLLTRQNSPWMILWRMLWVLSWYKRLEVRSCRHIWRSVSGGRCHLCTQLAPHFLKFVRSIRMRIRSLLAFLFVEGQAFSGLDEELCGLVYVKVCRWPTLKVHKSYDVHQFMVPIKFGANIEYTDSVSQPI